MRNYILPILFLLLGISAYAAPPSITSFSPTSAAKGTRVIITGTGFSGATAVSFGGTPAAAFTVVSNTMINALVGSGASGSISVTVGGVTGSVSGFTFLATSRIVTDFGGFWSTTTAVNSSTQPDSSHHLLAFSYGGTLYSTGVNDALLTSKGTTFSPGQWEALPVTNINGTNSGGNSIYLALAKKVDGSATSANTPAVSNYTIRKALTDGSHGLDLGTGFTNLPTSAVMTFQVYNMNAAKLADGEPDILLTQIADPSVGNDVFSFVDASGNVVGNSVTEDMTLQPSYGTYQLDLFNLTPNAPYNTATAYSAASANTTRNIRILALQLSNFGITASNVNQVAAMRIQPSGTSDYAFIAYNIIALNLTPSVTINTLETDTVLCSGGTANMAVIATPARGGALSYEWQRSTDGGTTWTTVTDGNGTTGATTNELNVVNPTNHHQYRVVVAEEGNVKPATSNVFSIQILTNPPPPSAVTVSSSQTTCLNTPIQLTSAVTGGTNLHYQWQIDTTGTFTDITNAAAGTYVPAVNKTGTYRYRMMAFDGTACQTVASNAVTVKVAGIASVTPATICQGSSATLGATATTGNVNWYATDTSATPIATGNTYTTPVLSQTTTYYVTSAGCSASWHQPVTATVSPATVAGMVSNDTVVLPGVNEATLKLGGYYGNVLKWQSSSDNFSTVLDIVNTSPQLTVTNLSKTTQYRALVQSNNCAALYSSTAVVVVAGPLPIRMSSLRVRPDGHTLQIAWTGYDQQNTAVYEVQRSIDGVHYVKVYTVKANNAIDSDYRWVDEHPVQGHSFYRIKEVLNNGEFAYSSVAWATFETGETGITVTGNPVHNKQLGLMLKNLHAGEYHVRLINAAGQVVFASVVAHGGGTEHAALMLPEHVHPGLYKLEVIAPDAVRRGFSLVVL